MARLRLSVHRRGVNAPDWADAILQPHLDPLLPVLETETPTASAVLQPDYDYESLLLTESGHPLATEGGHRLSLTDD